MRMKISKEKWKYQNNLVILILLKTQIICNNSSIKLYLKIKHYLKLKKCYFLIKNKKTQKPIEKFLDLKIQY